MDVPVTLGTTARAWDEQHLDLEAAAAQVRSAPAAGFTTGVAGAAARFAAAWARHTTEFGAAAEARADGLRSAAADFARTDRAVASDQLLLQAVLRETR